jgi:two-component system, NtrC family, sensor histidine kinase HydH
MAARKGKNLLEQALRIAQKSGRSPQARVSGLLRLAATTSGLSSATLYLADQTSAALTRRFSAVSPQPPPRCDIAFGQGSAGQAASTALAHNAPLQQLHPDEHFVSGEAAVLSIPLLDGKRVAGVLSLPVPESYARSEILEMACELGPVLMMTVAELLASERAEGADRRLALLSSLGELLNAPHSPETLLPQVLKLLTASSLFHCAIVRLTDDESESQPLFESCRKSVRGALPALLGAEPELSARTQAEGETCRALPGEWRLPCHAVCVPLGCNGRALGSMTFFGDRELVGPESVELAETVARLVSCALTEAIGSQRILRFARDNEKKVKELSLLYRMSNTMLSTLKLNKLIHLTLTALTSSPNPFFDRAMLFLVNERSEMLVGMLGVTTETSPSLPLPQGGGDDILSSRWDISEEEMAAQRASEFCRQVMEKRLELDGSLNIASQAVLEKRLIHIPGDDGFHPDRRLALAASPLIAHGQVVGAVLVDNALTGGPMAQEELRYLQLFTNQAGMAIENSMLYNRIEDANRQLKEAQDNLLQKERLAAIGEMAAGIAHELKGPLVSIGGFAGRLTKKLPQDSTEWGNAELIVREVLRLEGILSEILQFSRKPTICYTRCNIAEIVKESLAVVTPPLEEKQISVNTRFARKKLLLLGDAQQLKQVFINILLNALDAMGPGGKLVVQVAASDLEGKEAVCVKISDTGGGIPLEALNSIFTPFYTTKQSGTGLGLPIANTIITNHGGKIQISNNPGLGVEFRVILPKHW